MPTRVRRPRDKALVEGAVALVYQRISSRLAGKVFHSLAEVNAAIRELLQAHNDRPFSRSLISALCRCTRTCAVGSTSIDARSATMNSNQATIQKLELISFWGMRRALRQSMESPTTAEGLTPDELVARLVDAQ